MKRIAEIAADVGQGLLAGAIGTGVMTISSTLEMKARDREGSSAPADAAGKVLGVQPRDPDGQARFANVAHWGYGISWGAARGLIGSFGITGPRATAIHFAAVFGSEHVMLPSLDIAPPAWEQPPEEVAIDAFHHLVYAVATGIAFEALQRSS